MRRRLSVAVLALAMAALAAPGPASAKTPARCRPGRHVLAHGDGAVVWALLQRTSQGARDLVYVCAAPNRRAMLAFAHTGNVKPHVAQLKVAGHFVGFFLTTTDGVRQTDLLVFNIARGRKELSDYVKCSGNDECAGPPPMIAYLLADDGWVAEVYDDYNTAFPAEPQDIQGLLATHDGERHYPLDVGVGFAGLGISAGILHWTTDLGGASSVALGPAVVGSGTPKPLRACQLLNAADVDLVLGADPAAERVGAGECGRASERHAGMALTVQLSTGLSAARTQAAEASLDGEGWEFASWPDNDALQIYMTSVVAAGAARHDRQKLAAFAHGTEIDLTLTAPGVNAEEQLVHIANVAYDRLFGVPVTRSR